MTNQELLNKVAESGRCLTAAMRREILNASPEKVEKLRIKYHLIDTRSEEEKRLEEQVARLYALRRNLSSLSVESESHDIFMAFTGTSDVKPEVEKMAQIRLEIAETEKEIRQICGDDRITANQIIDRL